MFLGHSLCAKRWTRILILAPLICPILTESKAQEHAGINKETVGLGLAISTAALLLIKAFKNPQTTQTSGQAFCKQTHKLNTAVWGRAGNESCDRKERRKKNLNDTLLHPRCIHCISFSQPSLWVTERRQRKSG